MTINIQLHYRTAWGESVQLRLGKRRIPMEPSFGGLWQIMLGGRDIHDGDHFTFEVVRDGRVIKREWRAHHFMYHTPGKNIIVRSRWMEQPSNSAFYSSAFSDVIFRRPSGASFRHPHSEEGARGNVSIQVTAPEVRSHESVGLIGCGGHLGNWDQVHLTDHGRQSPLFVDVAEGANVYFTHSYALSSDIDESTVATRSHYTRSFASAIWQDNIYGVQFHPEKSSSTGLQILSNFVHVVRG